MIKHFLHFFSALSLLLMCRISDAQTIDLLYPVGGETFSTGQDINILAQATGVNNVLIEFSSNNGSSWSTVSTEPVAFGFLNYLWPAPSVNSTQCLIRLKDAANPGVTDQSQSTFSIVNPFIEIFYPNGGESFYPGQQIDIFFDPSSVTSVNMLYSTDNGLNWTVFESGYSVSGFTTYTWTVPAVNSTQCLIKIEDVSQSPSDITDAVFTISPQTISLELFSPNGGETIFAGNDFDIYYQTTGVPDIDLEYSDNGGLSWNPITSLSPGADGFYSYTWTTPMISSQNCLVRVMQSGTGAIGDTSDTFFSIGAPSQPDCAYNLLPADNSQNHTLALNLRWQYDYTNPADSFRLYLGTNPNPSYFGALEANFTVNDFYLNALTPNTTYYWMVVPVYSGVTASCTVQSFQTGNGLNQEIMNDTAGINDCSFGYFDAGGSGPIPSYLDVTQTLCPDQPGQAISIDFDFVEMDGQFYSLRIFDGPDDTYPLQGNYFFEPNPFNVTALNGTGCLTLKANASASGNEGWSAQVSCQNLAPASIVVVNPNGSEILVAGQPYTIDWTSQGLTNVDLDFSSDNGQTWTTITSNLASTGTYNWVVPSVLTSQAIIRISETGGSASDQSDAVFSIIAPGISIVFPNNGGTVQALTSANILFTAQVPSGNVDIDYSFDGGLNWNNVAIVNAAAGLYSWFVPNTPSANCLVKISDELDPAIADTSDLEFIISPPAPAITLDNPIGGENYVFGQNVNINWTSYSISDVLIEFSSDGGANWNNITQVPAVNATYSWTVPPITTNQAKIRVSDASNNTVFDESGDFNIADTSILVLSPNGGETFITGNYVGISWVQTGVGAVNIYYSDNSGTTWTPIVQNHNGNGFYWWASPSTLNSMTVKIKVEASVNAGVSDESDNVFSVLPNPPAIIVTSPFQGDVLLPGDQVFIQWQHNQVTNVRIQFSSDGGNNWSNVVNTYPAVFGQFLWTVPQLNSNQCKIRIAAVGNPLVNGVSFGFFSIGNLEITNPNGGELLAAGFPYNLQWNAFPTQALRVDYSTDNGSSWNNIAAAVSGDNVFWNPVPNTPSNQCLIRVTTQSGLVIDESDAVFTIVTPGSNTNVITIDSITGQVCREDTIRIYYTASGVYNAGNQFIAQISDGAGNFINGQGIGVLSSQSSGFIDAIIPSGLANGNGYQIRIIATALPTLGTPFANTIQISGTTLDFAASQTFRVLPNNGTVVFNFIGQPLAVQSFDWDFGNGGTANTAGPSHTYTNIGFYDVSLTITDLNGCQQSLTKNDFIQVEFQFPSSPYNLGSNADALAVDFIDTLKGCYAMSDGTCRITLDGGQNWTGSPTGAPGALKTASLMPGAWMVGGEQGFAALSSNLGANWTPFNLGFSGTITSISMLGSSDGLMVGSNGVSCKFDGTSWNLVNTGVTDTLFCVMYDGTRGIAAGENGRLLNFNAGSWTVLNTGSTERLKGTYFSNDTIYAIGREGLILKSTDNGASFNIILSGLDIDLNAITGVTADTLWVFGSKGIILRTFDGGNSWDRFTNGTLENNNGGNYKAAQRRGWSAGNGGNALVFGSGGLGASLFDKIQVSLKLAPNPAVSDVKISYPENMNPEYIRLSDMKGSRISVSQREASLGQTVLDISSLKPGIYFIEVSFGTYSKISKLVVAD